MKAMSEFLRLDFRHPTFWKTWDAKSLYPWARCISARSCPSNHVNRFWSYLVFEVVPCSDFTLFRYSIVLRIEQDTGVNIVSRFGREATNHYYRYIISNFNGCLIAIDRRIDFNLGISHLPYAYQWIKLMSFLEVFTIISYHTP